MTMYDVILDICNTKTNSLARDIRWGDVTPSTFMLQRWVSMTNVANATLVGATTNHVAKVLTPEMTYAVLSTMATKAPYKFRYMKPDRKKSPVTKKVDEPQDINNELLGNDKMYAEQFVKSLI